MNEKSIIKTRLHKNFNSYSIDVLSLNGLNWVTMQELKAANRQDAIKEANNFIKNWSKDNGSRIYAIVK
jgi:uncharacterized heparinase superfamily protein